MQGLVQCMRWRSMPAMMRVICSKAKTNLRIDNKKLKHGNPFRLVVKERPAGVEYTLET